MNISARYIGNSQLGMSTFDKVKYICYFIARSFLYAVLAFFLIFFLIMVVYFGDLFYNFSRGNNKMPLFNAYVIVSPSMVPTIKVNDAIVVRRCEGLVLGIGDIITFSSIDPSYPGLTVTHRIVGKQKAKDGGYIFRTKGDNNSIEDPALVNEDNVYGRVILKIPKLGYVRKFLLTPYGFTIGVIIPCFYLVISDIMKTIKKKRCNDDIDVLDDIEVI